MGVSSLTIGNAGSGYLTSPLVIITGDGMEAAAYGVITGGSVTNYIITNPGNNYRSIPDIEISGGMDAVVIAELFPTTIGIVSLTYGGNG